MFCWYRRLRLEAAVDDGRPLSAEETQHLAVCAACRWHHENLLALSRRLQQDAEAITAEPSAYFTARMLAALHRRQRHRRPALILWPIYAAMAVCLGLIMALAMIHFANRSAVVSKGDGLSPVTAVAALTDVAHQAMSLVGPRDVESLEPLFAASLAAEMARVGHDMQAAARFVAACLPVALENGKGAEDGT